MIISKSNMQVQRSWLFSLVVACLFSSGVTAVMLCIVLVVANQSSIETGTLSSKLQECDTRMRQLERQIMDMGSVLEKTEERLYKLEQVAIHISDQRTNNSSDGPRDPPLVHNAAAVENAEEINRNQRNGDDGILQESGVQRRSMAYKEQDEDNIKARWLRSTRQHKTRKRERPEREPKQCSRRCKGEKGDKGDVSPTMYGGQKGQRGESGPAGQCECHQPTMDPETTYATTTRTTTQYTMILAAHFEGDVESIASIATRDPINRGYVDLSAINGGWVPYWRYAQWMDAETRDKFYLDYRGNVTVIEGGIYYVYSQMLYYDPSVFMGHSLYIGGQKRFSCTECTVDRDRKFNTCYIGGVVQINPGDKVGVKVSYANRVINLNPDSTHFGMIRLS
ncbi:uncharacterized protein LOC119723832 isoform X2 [Patiria miniata]|uniref:THD domain-containing protein n=1 Tax=Patiria miniata TaxID=46514 RepID=A0A913ZGU3_PATMI|nr:uncharacterized protein LOC119723832 isoform X2 [Patiria miniata]